MSERLGELLVRENLISLADLKKEDTQRSSEKSSLTPDQARHGRRERSHQIHEPALWGAGH